MAFRQPTLAPQRSTYPVQEQLSIPEPQRPSERLEESQEWILFSPSAASITDVTNTTSTERTRTAGRSRISDFGGSLDTRARSYDYDDDDEAAEEDDEESGSTEELDSLDSHLHEFRAEPSVYNRRQSSGSGPVLPTHDGLGSFRIDQTVMGEDVQEQLYAFERYNPRRIKRRRESLELGALELAAEEEKARRIEAWRLEQSRVLVDEIQRETRRRKQSMTSERMSFADEQADVATLSDVEASIHGQAGLDMEVPEADNESFWNRITRRVIRDLMGIDDNLLSIIFGEDLPADDDSSTTPPARQSIIAADSQTWEHRLLERIARELGILVNQLSDHPGAFSTYLRTQEAPITYAGLPAIPETARPAASTSSLQTPEFQPTLPIPMQASARTSPPEEMDNTPRASQNLTREEWEKDLDIKMVFRYLRSRFTSPSSSPPDFTARSTLATENTTDTAARAARVRAHHPLVSRDRRGSGAERRTFKATVPSDSRVGLGMGVRRTSGNSSCASVSVKSLKRNSIGSGSRHYWDFGGSIGSNNGSFIASTGAMGSWGEV